ncbi:hypothetical protein ACHAXT_007847 [Thalassiosira profunda]
MKKLNIKGVLRRKSRTAGDSAAAASELSSAESASSADSVGGSMRSSVSGSMRSGTPAHTPSRKASASSAMSSSARSASTVNTGNAAAGAEAKTNNGQRTSAKANVSAPLSSMPPPPGNRTPPSPARRSSSERITPIGMHDGPEIDAAYETQVPLLEIVELPRGGVSVETQAVGHVQFGIPPETIKDSMRLGIAVPSVYIVPVDRFCREMGPALGVNLAEFEFPAYFNFFVQRKRCTLIVDSVDAERNIRRVFSETLLGPAQFRRGEGSLTHEEEDFAPDFPKEAIPDFHRELKHFRIMPNGKELVLETLLKFCHFESAPDSTFRDNLGAPPLGPAPGVDLSRAPGVPDLSGEGERTGSSASGEGMDVDLNGEPEGKQGVSENGMRKKAPKSLTYSQIRWIGDVAKIYPSDAPEDQVAQNKTKRVEIFKMPSGTDYVLHDIDENNVIVGKARFSGNVRVSEGISVIGLDEDKNLAADDPLGAHLLEGSSSLVASPLPGISLFNPPSFGVTVLGNSHGFDKSGSTSGYVLWINGRGVMIDPPPYSSATLEREGIRPRTIVGIILTHCHADHDAGAFQKVLTGSPVVVITTPTIYKSFIRKYAALSSLSPALLRHSHRYKPAIIGEPLRFQGATFHFTYTLHAIPCVGFRVDWRGRSMVFTGDHFNNPPALQKLVEKGIMSKARFADLNHLPLQETDLLLHEAGAPPIHTPLEVLLKLPTEVKKRLYVVHTSALPEGCELRVAPTGTAGTIRLDQIRRNSGHGSSLSLSKKRPSIFEANSAPTNSFLTMGDMLEDVDEYAESELFNPSPNVYAHLLGDAAASAKKKQMSEPPPVSLRPTSSSDAWFILNLLSAVPFLSSLSYTSTMEVLETARVVAYCCNEVVLSANRRSKYLVVVWEGTLMEREQILVGDEDNVRSSFNSSVSLDEYGKAKAVWYAGDWTGPRILQPEKRLSGDSSTSKTHDIVAMSAEGVKVIMVDFHSLQTVLRSGSPLYRRYHLSLSQQHSCKIPSAINPTTSAVFKNAVKNLNVIELLESNTGLRKLTAVQKRHLECLVEGPTVYTPGQRLWRSGSIVDKAFIVVAGTVSFVPKRRHGGSAGKNHMATPKHRVKHQHDANSLGDQGEFIGETMRNDAVKAVRELQANVTSNIDDNSTPEQDLEKSQTSDGKRSMNNSLTETDDYARLSRGLQKWAERHELQGDSEKKHRRGSSSTNNSPEISLHDFCDATVVQEEKKKAVIQRKSSILSAASEASAGVTARPSKNRFANKVLGRLYNRRAFASGLVFSRGHFLGDIEKMVEGLLSSTSHPASESQKATEDSLEQFGFGESEDALSLDTMTIHENEGKQHTAHSSTLAAGKDGCVVLILPKASLIPFLDAHPGLLLSLLGTQVVV